MEKKKIEIKLTTIIIFAVLIGILILVMLLSILESDVSKNAVAKNQMSVPVLMNQATNLVTNQVEPVVVENMEDSFSFEFMKMENNENNMIYSPLSIKYALSMLSEGASGNTKVQIDNIIGRLNLTKYKNIEKVLSLANAIYIRDTYAQNVKENFRSTLMDRYDAEVKYDPFEDAKNVNSWIENKTFEILKNIVKDSTVQQSEMLLINALAIDMKWANEFDESNTYGKEFTLENGEEIIVTTMNKETTSDKVSYYKDNTITALTMDLDKYEDAQLEFMAIMPDKNLNEYVKTVTAKEIKDITNKLVKASETKNGVDISIPKFEFNYELQLKEDLQKLGITDAFVQGVADFSDMSEEKLYVGEAIHQADVKFSEEGIRAAAVTVFAMFENSIAINEKQPININIDKPFMFLIRDKENGEIWFVGTVYEPNLWENDKEEYKMNF